MFNVVPQWNLAARPRRISATLHNLSGGRGILGVGRGTVPREVLHLNDKGVSIGLYDNPDQAADDDRNRRVRGARAHRARRPGPARRSPTRVSSSTSLLCPHPRPGQHGAVAHAGAAAAVPVRDLARCAVISLPTLEYVPVVGHGAVFWNQHHAFIKRFWDTYGERYAAAHDGHVLAPHERRMLVVSVRIEDTHEKALETATPGHDEFWKFGPYGWSRGYMGPDGKPAQPGLIPTLAESIENKTILVGTPDEVAEGVAFYRDLLGLEHLTIFPHLLYDPYKKADEQMARFIDEVASSAELLSAGLAAGAPVELAGGEELHRDGGGADATREVGAPVDVEGVVARTLPVGRERSAGNVVTMRPARRPVRIRVTRSAHSGCHRDALEEATEASSMRWR